MDFLLLILRMWDFAQTFAVCGLFFLVQFPEQVRQCALLCFVSEGM